MDRSMRPFSLALRRLPTALLLVALATPISLHSQIPTQVLVRVTSHDAKIVGSGVGGARVTIRDLATGQVLAEGVQEGSTGSTDHIMGTRERGGTVFATEGAARFLAEVPLAAPTLVEIVGEGPLGTEHAIQRTTKTMLLIPGRDVLGEGVILELMGFTVVLEEPAAGTSIAAGTPVDVTARVTMLCGCPTEPGGRWDADRIEITLRALRGDRVVEEWPLAFAGETSTYHTVVRLNEPGDVTLQVIASDPAVANFGMVEGVVTVVP